MPVFTAQHQCAALFTAQIPDFFRCVHTDGLLHGLTLPVQLTELAGQILGQCRIIGFQQFRRQIRLAHTAGGIDAGREHKTDLNGCNGLTQQAGLFQQRMDTHKIGVGQSLQTAGNDGAVFAFHAHHVGNGADGGQSAVTGKEGVLAVLTAQRKNQLQRNADAGQMLEGIGAVGTVGIHHRNRVGQQFLALMMVCHHHVHAERVGKLHFLVAGNAAVHRDQQRGTLIVQALNRLAGQAVSVLNTAGNISQTANAAALQIILKQHGGRNAVHIVIAENGNGLAVCNGALDALHGLVHILHQHGGNRQVAFQIQILRSGLCRSDAAGRKNRRKEVRIARAAQPVHILFRRGIDVPLFKFHGASSFPGIRIYDNYFSIAEQKPNVK